MALYFLRNNLISCVNRQLSVQSVVKKCHILSYNFYNFFYLTANVENPKTSTKKLINSKRNIAV